MERTPAAWCLLTLWSAELRAIAQILQSWKNKLKDLKRPSNRIHTNRRQAERANMAHYVQSQRKVFRPGISPQANCRVVGVQSRALVDGDLRGLLARPLPSVADVGRQQAQIQAYTHHCDDDGQSHGPHGRQRPRHYVYDRGRTVRFCERAACLR